MTHPQQKEATVAVTDHPGVIEIDHVLEADDIDAIKDHYQPVELALTDRAGADRHLAEIQRLDAEYELEKAGVLVEVERLQQWLARRYEETTAQTGWHHGILERYHRAVVSVDPKLKTLKLPHGELRLRAQQPSWEIDTEVTLAWAQANLIAVVRPPKPGEPTLDLAALKRSVGMLEHDGQPTGVAVTPDGEIVPGITITDRGSKFSIVASDDEGGE